MATEWVSLTSAGGVYWGWLLAALLVVSVSTIEFLEPPIVTLLLVPLCIAVVGTVFAKYSGMKSCGWWLIGSAYVSFPLVALWWLREVNGILVLWVLLIVWATDIGGYFAGKGIGGPKLAPKISPKKTWAGLLGGMALSVSVGLVLMVLSPFGLSFVQVILFSAGFAIWSQVGDLLESGVKRSFGVKDSGGLIPGHGGLLDRVDGLVFVAPAVAFSALIAPDLFKVVL